MIKSIISVMLFVVSGLAGVFLAFSAQHYQVLHQPMPNGKGGFMTPLDGYLLAMALLLMAVAALIVALKSVRIFWGWEKRR